MHSSTYLTPLFLAVLLLPACSRENQPDSAQAAVVREMNRGVALMGQYQYDSAAQAFESVLKQAPKLTEARINLAMALFNRGRKEDGDLDRSSELLDMVLKEEPRNVRALYFKGIIAQHIGKTELAVECFDQVAKMRPEDGAVWYLLGISKQRLGQPAEAELLRAVQFRPYLASAWYKLSQTARLAGDQAKATQYLQQFTRVRESPLSETIELPQYNQMGDLALVQPLPPHGTKPVAAAALRAGPQQEVASWTGSPSEQEELRSGIAAGDLNGDGLPDLLLSVGKARLFLGTGSGKFKEANGIGLEGMSDASSCALGDFDNDEKTDLLLCASAGPVLFRGNGQGHFTNVTVAAGLTGIAAPSSAIFLDADHDSDLDIFVCHPDRNQLWNNNGDGKFVDIAQTNVIACVGGGSVMVLPGDLDRDRDMDLVVLAKNRPARVFINDLLGQYQEGPSQPAEMLGNRGGALQDFSGDGALDLFVLGGNPAQARLYLGDAQGGFKPSQGFLQNASAAASWTDLRELRAADVDLDGDLDVILISEQAHLLLNDGQGRFVLSPNSWALKGQGNLTAAEAGDLNGDLWPDLVWLRQGAQSQVVISFGELPLPGTSLGLLPSGVLSRDKRTRSPASGFGVQIVVRAGLLETRYFYTGQSGGSCQSTLPYVAGLGGAPKADYVHLQWPDGVAQAENALAAGQVHKIAEVQRKVSSCPVLFGWNGSRFEFITDFAGVGGLGYYASPGVATPPQVVEHVKIEPGQLQARDGFYDLRVTEPMEEVAYLDRLELWAIDHPTNSAVFPDERLAINGPSPTHEWLVVTNRIHAVKARSYAGADCTERLLLVDRQYAYDPPLDRRYCGFCRPHTLELDFGDRLGALPASVPVYLFVNGFIEYPYSQTVYAASQSRIGWEPIRVERLDPNGGWQVVVPDGGAPGGMARTFTIDLTGQVSGPTCRLRLTTNLEIYYDQLFVGVNSGMPQVRRHALPLRAAELQRVGFAREYSPDGRLPLIYDYHLSDTTAPFHIPHGAYTRFGPVDRLLRNYDDQFVIMGPGDEVALRFDATGLPEPSVGWTRSFILVSHAYCKDMDLYTATPETVEPLPFRGMSRYPYTAPEQYPDSARHDEYKKEYNTREHQGLSADTPSRSERR